jgi:primary-amine oxidase
MGLRIVLRLAAVLLAATAGHAATAAAQLTASHPLDALTSQEHRTVARVIRTSEHMDTTTVFVSVQLSEPAKTVVRDWTAGTAFPRHALAVLRQGDRTIEAVVDVANERLVSWTVQEGMHAEITRAEYGKAEMLIKQHPEVRAALERRGITDLATVSCFAGPSGYFARPEQLHGRRILRGGCHVVGEAYNWWGRQIEGLVVTLDIGAGEVLDVRDAGPVGRSTATDDFDVEAVGPLRDPMAPIQILQPLGPGFTRNGGLITWGDWQFHLRVDSRVGVVLSTVGVRSGDAVRSVLYRGSLSEIFVPYQDSTTGWYERVFIDAGEYATGGIAEALEPGVDCPDYAVFIDGVVAGPNGFPVQKRRLVCLFERTMGSIGWRHGYENTERVDGRPARELVVRWNATVGNYDYVFDWVLQQNGSIGVRVGATGILEVRAVDGTTVDAVDPEVLRFGRMLAANVVGVNHDHFFSFRLDLDVDGVDNAFERTALVTEELPADHPRRSLWTVQSAIAQTESEAQLDIDLRRPAIWRIINPSVTGPLGYPVSYQIKPGGNAMTLLLPDDWAMRRVAFANHHLWVTPYAEDELYAAGAYPTLSDTDFGLPTWTEADRPIVDTDIVAWYTLGFHHVPRAEDWPVMPTAWYGFEIRPFDFFPTNPILDLPLTP